MNIALRKLAMLEKSFQEQEEAARINGYSSIPVDPLFRERVAKLMEKVRTI